MQKRHRLQLVLCNHLVGRVQKLKWLVIPIRITILHENIQKFNQHETKQKTQKRKRNATASRRNELEYFVKRKSTPIFPYYRLTTALPLLSLKWKKIGL